MFLTDPSNKPMSLILHHLRRPPFRKSSICVRPKNIRGAILRLGIEKKKHNKKCYLAYSWVAY